MHKMYVYSDRNIAKDNSSDDNKNNNTETCNCNNNNINNSNKILPKSKGTEHILRETRTAISLALLPPFHALSPLSRRVASPLVIGRREAIIRPIYPLSVPVIGASAERQDYATRSGSHLKGK